MASAVTHFEIYAEDPAKLAEFYRTLLGWQVDKAPGIDYWRIDTGAGEARASAEDCCSGRSRARAAGCTTSTSSRSTRPSSGLVELGGSVVRPKAAVPKAAWYAVVADPDGNIFAHLAGRPVGDAGARTRRTELRRHEPETETRRKSHALHRRRAVSREHATADHHRGAVWADVAAGRRARHSP